MTAITNYTDRFGRFIHLGDYLVVPCRRGSRCWTKVCRAAAIGPNGVLAVRLEDGSWSHLKVTREALVIQAANIPFSTLENLTLGV